jgi:hypothetical protein
VVWRWIAVTLGVLFVAAVVVYGVFGANVTRWGCPSQEELERPRSVDQVRDAFARHDLELVSIPWPAELRHARSYAGAVVMRHQRGNASVTVIVCRSRCEITRSQLRPGKPRRRYRGAYNLLTVATWVTAANRRSQARLSPAVREAVDDLDPNPEYGSRCYVG